MSPSSRSADKLIQLGAVPRAHLLPPELKAEVRLRAQRRLLAGIVVLSLVVAAAGVLYVSINSAASGLRLEASNATSATLLAQKQEYIEITQLQTQLAKDQAAQIVGVATEIDWKEYLLLVQASLPPGTAISSISARTLAPGTTADAPSAPLLKPSLATIDFIATTPTLPDVSAWIENLATIPGFANATAGTITLRDDGQYTVTISMNLNEAALANRYFEGTAVNEDAGSEETTP